MATSEAAQSLVSKPEKPKKRRTRAEKVGRLKHIIDLENRILKEISQLRITQRYMIQGLDIGGYLVFDQPYIEKVCCLDDVDKAVLNELHEAGAGGILPKDLASALREKEYEYELNRWQVLRRIQRMNKRLNEEIAQNVAEKQGHEWALTSFAREAWGSTKEELQTNGSLT